MKVIAIGKNYAAHAKEMSSNVPTEPVFFLKADTAIVRNNEAVYYPEFTKELHYETELVVRIARPGKSIAKEFAHRYYDEIALGIDFTARDLQRQLSKEGLPWAKAKCFDQSAPLGPFVDKTNYANLQNLNLHLNINGNTVQKGNTADMVFDIDTLIAYVSQFMTLKMGDLIFTGTPEGVGPVVIGDRLQAYLEGECMLDFEIK